MSMENLLTPIITYFDHLMILDYGFDKQNLKKVALFDLDSTLLKLFANDISKFEYMYPPIPEKLRNLHDDGYKLIIVSNQSLAIENNELELIKLKLQKFILDIKLPFLIFISLGRNKYRKPSIGIYEYIRNNYGSNIEDIFYVGDAAGPRLNSYSAYSDIKFAYNCQIKFYTPEEYFLGVKNYKQFKIFDVTKFKQRSDYYFEPIKSENIFVFGTKKYSGVTFFIKKYFPEYTEDNIYINCHDIKLIQKFEHNSTFYLLDYSQEILTWKKGFFYCSGLYYKKTYTPVKKHILDYLSKKLIKVPFIYDESGFTEEQKRIARLQLC
ncbi:bifunctional polynucleotide phosphatase/kinase (PNK1) [Vairimorpha necatrix]|uniref:Bifunctional polynucleotide phosphatase/kinase (PNK1) n=1 Tax=Vairimorpha necatrix TaxID=6039 RepID=A0AAX4JB75_9MICR